MHLKGRKHEKHHVWFTEIKVGDEKATLKQLRDLLKVIRKHEVIE